MSSSTPSDAGGGRRTVLLAAAVVPSATEAAVPDAGVVVEGDRIVGVGPADRLPGDADVLDLRPWTLVPGLVDAHAHLGFDGSLQPDAVMQEGSDEDLARLCAENARRYLQHGVTTVRDLGCRGRTVSGLRDAIAAGRAVGPRIVASDAPVTITGGHCWYMSEQCDTEAEVVAAVRSHAEQGADVVKVMLTGGFLHPEGDTPHRPVYDLPVLRALVDEAHLAGMRVAVHAHGVDGIRRAVDAGVDTIEHCTMTTREGVRYDTDLARRIAAQGIVVVPTLNRRWLDDDLPWTSGEVAIGVLRRLREDGVQLAVGTDCGIDGVGHADHLWGIKTLVAAGMTPAEAFAAATETGAAALGLSAEVGRLVADASADLIAVEGDPRSDLDLLESPPWVMARGAPVHDRRSAPPPPVTPTVRP